MRLGILAAVSTLGVLALVFFDPGTSSVFPPCLFRLATGYLCPGCGSARALHAFVHGDFASALQFNPLPFSLMPMAAVEIIGSPNSLHARPAFVKTLVAAIVLFGIVRNFA